jgi:hypothetical protein
MTTPLQHSTSSTLRPWVNMHHPGHQPQQVLLQQQRGQQWVPGQQQQLGRLQMWSILKFGTGTWQRLGCPGC